MYALIIMEIWKIIYFKICVLIFFISSEIQRNTQCVGCKCSNKERQRERNSETKETKSAEKSKFMLKHLNRYSYCPVLLSRSLLDLCYFVIWGRCNLKRSRRTVIFLPAYKISSLKITPPKTPNSGQFSYPLPNIVSFLFE